MKLKLSLNLNDTVKIKLTDRGREIVKKHYKEYPGLQKKFMRKTGYIEVQVHEMMNIFGDHMIMGLPSPFKHNEILIEISKLYIGRHNKYG